MKKEAPRSPSMKASGFHVRFRIRSMRKRIVRKNKRAKFYEGNYVYLRVRGPDGLVREIYLGTSSSSSTPRPPATSSDREIGGVETRSRARSSSTPATGGRTRGQKTWRDASDETASGTPNPWSRYPKKFSSDGTCTECGEDYGEHDGSKCQ